MLEARFGPSSAEDTAQFLEPDLFAHIVENHSEDTALQRSRCRSNYPPAEPEALRLLAPQRGLIATDQSQKQAQRTCAGIPDVLKTGRSTLPDLSNFYCLPGRAGGSLNGLVALPLLRRSVSLTIAASKSFAQLRHPLQE